jgi:hypothetical protein
MVLVDYIGILIFTFLPYRAHQTRLSGRNSRPISAEVTLPQLQSEIKVSLFLFASHSFLANSLRFMVNQHSSNILLYFLLGERKKIQSLAIKRNTT